LTRKSFARLQRARAAAAKKGVRGDAAGAVALLEPSDIPSRAADDPSVPDPGSEVSGSAANNEPQSGDQPAKKTPPISARCAIVAAAFRAASDSITRRQLKSKSPIAVAVLVPGSSWIEPVRMLFIRRFGERWQTALEASSKTTAARKAEQNAEVAAQLSRGLSVIGVAVERDALPSVLIAAADLTIRLDTPRGVTIGRAIRMFTGQLTPTNIDDKIAFGLDFDDLVAAFRANSSPAEILQRLRQASPTARSVGTIERLPKLDDAIEYGAARTWGMALARDLAEYRAGRLDWQDVDRGAVLFSEPGLGKSMFARILAQACDVPLVAFSIADLFASSPGYLDSVVKASRAMFERAAALRPCILFLDEIDALPNRATMSPRGADWWTPVITDFLLSLDNAVAGKRAGIVVIGATNNIQGVDAALLRPGRLERAIEVKRPDQAGALNILRHHLNGELSDAELNDIAALLNGSSGAEIMMIVRGARRIARSAARKLICDDLFQSIAPAEEIEPNALNRICVHEAAHAVASIVLSSGVLKYCAVGRSAGALGRTLYETKADDLATRDSVERRAIVSLSGRAAEILLIGDAGLGAGGDDESDLAQVTQFIATLHGSSGLGDTLTYITSFENALAAVRDDCGLRLKVEKHLRILQRRAEEIVQRHRDAIVSVTNQLKARRQLSGDEIRRIVATTSPNQIEIANC
jgi:AAA+ superfamily predicted ATPase